jgi:hypothetical protein
MASAKQIEMIQPGDNKEKLGSYIDRLEIALTLAGVIVVSGLLVEDGPDLWAAITERRFPPWGVIGGLLVSIGVLFEVVIAFVIARIAKRIDALSSAEVENTRRDASAAIERAAKAEQAAAEADLARARIEEQLYKPHALNEQQIAELSDLLKPYAGRSVDVFIFDGHINDVLDLALAVATAFESGGWKPKVWMGAEPRIWGDEVTLAVARESLFEHSRNSNDLSSVFAAISGFLSNMGITVSVGALGFSAENSAKPFMGGAEWDPGDVAPCRVQVGQRQFRRVTPS